MANEKETVEVTQLPPRIHVSEFLASTDANSMEKAGFTAYMDGITLMRRDDWEAKLKEYRER